MTSGFGVSVWFLELASPPQYTTWLKSPLAFPSASINNSKLTAGIPHTTALKARLYTACSSVLAGLNTPACVVVAASFIASVLFDAFWLHAIEKNSNSNIEERDFMSKLLKN